MALAISLFLAAAACSDNGGGGGGAEVKGAPPTADGSERKEFTTLSTEDPYWFNYLAEYGTDGPCVIIDGLVEYDMYGVVVPSMATEWSKSEDGLVYTYKLREGAKWVNYKCEEYAEVTADDFVAGAKFILTPENECGTANLVYDYLVNAKAYFDGEITDFSQVGVKAVDKYTVEYTLKEPCPYFIKLSGYNCYWPVNQKFLDEVGDKFGTTNEYTLYNGAYYCPVKLPEDRTEFVMNPNYWNAENIYISKITSRFNKDTSIQGEMFHRGELDFAYIPAELKEEWITDTEGKGKWAQRSPYDANAWFYGFNFEPTYEGNGVEDYKIAVNNRNFRKAIFHAFDRMAICYYMEQWIPEQKIMRTISPENIFTVDGVDYTQMGPLKEISNTDPQDTEKALEFKKAAMEELQGKVTFPIKLVVPYKTSDKLETNAAQIIDQNLERVLGTDFVEVVAEAYAPTNYNTLTRSAGNFSFMLMRWGADYADPASYTDIFNPNVGVGLRYNRPFLATEYIGSDGVSEYVKLMQAGIDERLDVKKRYELLAEAEAFLINEAMVMPCFHGAGGWRLNKLHPYIGNCGQFGRDEDIMKGKKLMDEPFTREEFEKVTEEYNAAREEALKNAQNQN